MPTKVIMPQLGESVVEGTVTKWLHQEGEQIAEFDSLLEVNTDKVDTEIPSPASGTILKILVAEGTTVEAGTPLAWIGEPGEEVPSDGDGPAQTRDVPATPPAAQEDIVPDAAAETRAVPVAPPAEEEDVMPDDAATRPVSARLQASREAKGSARPQERRDLGFISPVVARMADEHQVDLQAVEGTGEGGRITKRDVQAYLDQRSQEPEAAPQEEAEPGALAPWETPGEGDLFRPTEMMFPGEEAGEEPPQPAKAARPAAPAAEQPAQPKAQAVQPGQLVSLSPMRKRIAEHMVHSKSVAAHVTTVMEANLQRVVQHREANKARFSGSGVNLTYSAYFAAAAVEALKAYPLVNSSWTDEGIRIHPEIHIGMAVSLGEEGLIVPVIKAADGYSLLGIARAINDLANRARSRQLKPDEVRGGTFSITNHGTAGSLFATPIINQPQTGILGVGAIQKRVVVIDDAIAIRPMVYLSLTFDHRILDGASADGFLAKVVETLENWDS